MLVITISPMSYGFHFPLPKSLLSPSGLIRKLVYFIVILFFPEYLLWLVASTEMTQGSKVTKTSCSLKIKTVFLIKLRGIKKSQKCRKQ